MTTTPTNPAYASPPVMVFLTPTMAEEYLEHNIDNRSIRNHLVDSIARDMAAGNWVFTGDPIQFDVTGTMINGQHRCWAVVQSGVTVPIAVQRGLPVEARNVIDTGARRSTSDVLGFQGFRNSAKLTSTIRIAKAREDGYYTTVSERRRPPSYTTQELLDFAERHPELQSAVIRGNASYRRVGTKSTGLWSYCLSEFDIVNAEDSITFERSLAERRSDGAGDPRSTLSRWLTDNGRAPMHSSVVLPRTMFAVFRAWNAWRAGETLSKIQINVDAAIPDPM